MLRGAAWATRAQREAAACLLYRNCGSITNLTQTKKVIALTLGNCGATSPGSLRLKIRKLSAHTCSKSKENQKLVINPLSGLGHALCTAGKGPRIALDQNLQHNANVSDHPYVQAKCAGLPCKFARLAFLIARNSGSNDACLARCLPGKQALAQEDYTVELRWHCSIYLP